MKLTKVNNVRIAVSKNDNVSGRAILYPVPNEKKELVSVLEEQIEKRVEKANELYHVFYRYDIPKDLEHHFVEIFNIACRSSQHKIVKDIRDYKGYYFKGKEKNLESFSYNPSEKKIQQIMSLHVQQRMNDIWQQQEFCEAAVSVLVCLCSGKNYKTEIKRVSEKKLLDFLYACKECKRNKIQSPYVEETSMLENIFSQIMRELVKRCDKQAYYENNEDSIEKNLKNQITFLQDLKYITLSSKNNKIKINLDTYQYLYATEERMNAILIRMRKTLKRGRFRQTAILLLQAVSRMNDITLKSTINNMDEDQIIELKKFLYAVNKDYYRMNITKSVKKINVKVQPNGERLDLANVNHKKKAELNKTLEEYASSKENSDAILLCLKGLLFEYFPLEESISKEKFLTIDKIWVYPEANPVYFDYHFVPEERFCKNKNIVEPDSLEILCKESLTKAKQNKIKNRIKYVNYGKYLHFTVNEEDSFRKYWFSFIQEYIENNYLDKSIMLSYEDCISQNMMRNCWKDMIRFLCSKYIDIGKTIYHFVMPAKFSSNDNIEYSAIKEEYKDGISSFSYEIIKAEETLQREIADATTAAVFNFSRAVLDYQSPKMQTDSKMEDILFVKKEEIITLLKKDVGNQILRFYGGMSEFAEKGILVKVGWEQKFVLETIGHLGRIRNQNFHYTPGKETDVSIEYAKLFMQNDIDVYQQLICKKYYSNNVTMFYPEKEIIKLVQNLYHKITVSEAHIPAFRTVWKKKDLPQDIDYLMEWDNNHEKSIVYEGALYFLLKEIYYHDFILQSDISTYFFEAVDEYVKSKEMLLREFEQNAKQQGVFDSNTSKKTLQKGQKNTEKKKDLYTKDYESKKKCKEHHTAGVNFQTYLKKLRSLYKHGEITFGTICQSINEEYNQQNAKETETTIYKHFKLLFPLCLKKAFQEYIKVKYPFLLKPVFCEKKGEPDYLENVKFGCVAEYFSKESLELQLSNWQYSWYTFGHFISPRQLNYFIGDLKNYVQYRQDILRRTEYAGQFIDEKAYDKAKEEVEQEINRIKEILQVLELVKVTAGRISNIFKDYYENEEEYAKYIYQYIDFELYDGKSYFESFKYFCQNTLPNGEVIDLYADAVNPKVLRNIELTRMYAGGDMQLKGHKKITGEDVQLYYNKKQEMEKILSNGLCETKTEQQTVQKYQNLKKRLTLNDVTEFYEIINALLGQLVSLVYLRERDELFLHLGFYSMALRNEKLWENEILNSLDKNNLKIQSGLVLYQVIGTFDFDVNLVYQGTTNNKWKILKGASISIKKEKFYANHENSSICALRLFRDEKYDGDIKDLRNYIEHFKYFAHNDKSLLELYNEFYTKFFGYNKKLRKSVLFVFQSLLENYFVKSSIKFVGKNFELAENLKSDVFTYKLQKDKTVTMPARDEVFLQELQQILEYKK